MKRWFLTVDWCGKGHRGVFCDRNGNAFGKDSQHTEDEMGEILGPFDLVLAPQSLELTDEEAAQYTCWRPLAEYTHQYGVAHKPIEAK